jgi:hypothetical protein
MPDHVRSVADMLHEMKKIVEEPPANTSHAKHRQHVAQAITQLIRSEVTERAQRTLYIADTVGSKPATKSKCEVLEKKHELRFVLFAICRKVVDVSRL